MDTIFIPGNTPSSKNSKQITKSGFIVHSKQCQKYYKETNTYWKENKDKFLELVKDKPKPYKVCFKFIRDSKRRFDFINPCQTVSDLMVKYGWIDDDNMNEIIPSFEPHEVDKENAGVYITVL